MCKLIKEQNIAEAVGQRVLQWKGGEFLELIYLMEEKNAVNLLRLFTSMSDSAQKSIIEFMAFLGNLENPELRVDHSGLHIEKE